MTPARIFIVLGGALAGALLLRAPALVIGDRVNRMGEAREESAYVLGPRPLSFPVAPGMRTLRLLVNLDRTAAADGAPAPVALRVRTEPEGHEQEVALAGTAVSAVDAGPVAFYLDSSRQPGPTRVLGIERDSDRGGVVSLWLASPHDGSGVIRLQTLERRAIATGEPRWTAVPAVAGSERRRIYLLPPPPVAAPMPLVGVELAAEKVATWTIAGPATISLGASTGPLRGQARLLAADGKTTDQAVDLPPGGVSSYAVGPGLTTVRFVARSSARVVLTGPPSAAGALARPLPLPDGRFELRPRALVVEAARVGPGQPVTYDLRGRRPEAPLRVEARAPMDKQGDGRVARVVWRVRRIDNRIAASGATTEPLRAAPEDALAGDERPLSDATSFFLWTPEGGARLELEADRQMEVTVFSPAWVDEAEEPAAVSDGALAELRHGPEPAHRKYFKIDPSAKAALAAAGRLDRLVLAPRLELRTTKPLPVPAGTVTPVGQVARVEMLVPDAAIARLPSQVWKVSVGHEMTLISSGGSANLIYAASDGSSARGTVTASVDDHVVLSSPLSATRGQFSVGVPAGEHRLRVEAPSGTRVFCSLPLRGAATFRRVAMFPLRDRGRIRVRITKGASRYVLGVVLYGTGATPRAPTLKIVIDGGLRRAGGFSSRDRTALARSAPLVPGVIAETLLLNTSVGPSWRAQPVFITLGDDLAEGAHTVSVEASGASGPMFVRFFGHDGIGRTAGEGTLETLALDGTLSP